MVFRIDLCDSSSELMSKHTGKWKRVQYVWNLELAPLSTALILCQLFSVSNSSLPIDHIFVWYGVGFYVYLSSHLGLKYELLRWALIWIWNRFAKLWRPKIRAIVMRTGLTQPCSQPENARPKFCNFFKIKCSFLAKFFIFHGGT